MEPHLSKTNDKNENLNVLQAVFPDFWESRPGKQILQQDREDFPYPWPESYWKQLSTEHLNGSHLYYAVDEEQGDSAHKVQAWALFDFSTDRLAHLQKIFVDSLSQGQGLGTRFLKGCLDFCQQHFHSQHGGQVELEVATDNSAAISLYNHLGFEVVRREKGFYSDGRDAYKMRCSVRHSA